MLRPVLLILAALLVLSPLALLVPASMEDADAPAAKREAAVPADAAPSTGSQSSASSPSPAATVAPAAASSAPVPEPQIGVSESSDGLARVIFVGNNWEGTADVLRFDAANATFSHLARLDIVPDLEERKAEMLADPQRQGYFLAIRALIGEGNDQFVDDMYSTPDGRLLVVSRPSLADVVALDLETGEIAWRFRVDGQRSDHMAISPDGKHVAVSASTAGIAHILDTSTGKEVGRFDSGDTPHENTYSANGSLIFHASIGLVYTPTDQPEMDTTKGERVFQVVDAATNEVLRRVDMGRKLAEAGYEGMSSAVRPMAISPDERFVYFQVSFFHGFAEYDLVEDRVLRVAELPNLVPDLPRELYLLDSAHHGIAMNAAGTKLCVAGTMSDYAAIVDRETFEVDELTVKPEGKAYWATTADDGEHCLVSWSGTDTISAFSYATGKEVASIEVGNHPQRVRTGVVTDAWMAARQHEA